MPKTLGYLILVPFVILHSSNVFANANSTCAAMINDGRANGATMDQCICMYETADDNVDEDIAVLLFKAWREGVPVMDEIAHQPRQRRVEQQLTALKGAMQRQCPNLPF
ncbi:MAG: hypothetical protein AAFR98_09135 [Pseudomonadota bacterium]